jgi:outer membrane lipoprotein-sorting protein
MMRLIDQIRPVASRLFLLGLFVLFFSGRTAPGPAAEDVDTRQLVQKMISSIKDIRTLRYNLKCSERINGKMVQTESQVKLQAKPRKVYLYLKGPEVLWIEGQNNGQALVNPNSFPYVNLNLDPYGSIMRKDQHHTIHEMGFAYLGDILETVVTKVGDDFNKYFDYSGEDKFQNRPCHKVLINNHDFTYVNYTVKKGENLVTIARKLKVSEYMILEKNKLSDYHSVKEGQEILVPNSYAKLVMLSIDKQNNLPVSIKTFDDKGLFESYEYHNLQVNVKIPDEEFSKSFKDYKF